jgi:PTS system mannose-specific IIB component
MSIVLARIDNRLIHGQVLESWVPYTHANCIVVANDEVAGLTFQRTLMEAAVPRGIRVVIGTIEEIASLYAAGELDVSRVLLLFASSADALQAHRHGVHFAALNLGNMHGGAGKMRLSCTIALDPVDIGNLKLLEESGVRIVSQCIPSDREQSWRKLIREAGD